MPAISSTFKSGEPSLPDILRDIKDGKIQLPDFQRGWVWDVITLSLLLPASPFLIP